MSVLHNPQYSSGGALITSGGWNADHAFDANGINGTAGTSAPTAPATGKIALFAKNIAGRILAAFIGPTNVDTPVQPHMGFSRAGLWASVGNQNLTLTNFGLQAPATTGTLSTRSVSTTNMYQSTRRSGLTTASTAGSSAGFRMDRLQFWRGNAAGLGGFFLVARFGQSDTISDGRSFVGLCGVTTAFGNVDPSTNLNIIGVGHDSADTSWQIMTNDGTGTATKTALGANFPVNTSQTDLYELTLFAAPNDTAVGWIVKRLNTGDVQSGSITTDLPASTQLLAFQHWRNNGATASTAIAELVSLYVETDY